jgi:histidinol-phosphate aminotransferase
MQSKTSQFSRRDFGRLAALMAGAGMLPILDEPTLAQLSAVPGGIPKGAVKIDANENPLGPCPEALEAARAMVAEGGRYLYAQTDSFVDTLASQEGVSPAHVRAYPGSSLPLHHAVMAFTSPGKPLVIADPGYEAGERAARIVGAPVRRVPLDSHCAHDVKAMAAASAEAGLIYVCNPNNPTGTITPRGEIEWLLDNKPRGAVVLLDEAYIHFSDEPVCADLVARGKDLIILRTFSKLYGMAGLRAGAAIARPDLLERMSGSFTGALPTPAMAAAVASLKSANLVNERRKMVADVRNQTLGFLKKLGYDVTPSASNCFMVNVKRPGGEVIAALRRENVYIGRIWPSWPTWVRVTVGTGQEMAAFQAAFARVMG